MAWNLAQYLISSTRRRGFYLLRCSFCEATIRGRRLLIWKAWRHRRRLDRVRTSETVTVARRCQCSTRSLSVLLSAVGTTRTTQTILAHVVLMWWPSSEIIRTRVRVPHFSCRFRLCGYYSRAASIRGIYVLTTYHNLYQVYNYCQHLLWF